IIYQNPQETIFIVDIPTSIQLAQTLPNNFAKKQSKLLYSTALKSPYPSSPEPKTDAARARVLERIPDSEKSFLEKTDYFVKFSFWALQGQRGLSDIWCYPRVILQDGASERDDRVGPDESVDIHKKKRKFKIEGQDLSVDNNCGPPIILSASSINEFSGYSDLRGAEVRNPSLEPVVIQVKDTKDSNPDEAVTKYTIPPKSSFVLNTLSAPSITKSLNIHIIPNISKMLKFNIILLDPPWPNRSVRRSSQYHTHRYLEMDTLVSIMIEIIRAHLTSEEKAFVAIWTTNNAKSRQSVYEAFELADLEVSEEWIWLKVTEHGEPVVPLNGLWRKPYEVLLIGTRKVKDTVGNGEILKRLIIAVPDIHSRKPNLKELFESLYFGTNEYMALEVFARNLTSGWYSCGNDVLRFNAGQWWLD
ncbi:MT-A70-domain-containing protein, partial [Talaromyces proteolyticus]